MALILDSFKLTLKCVLLYNGNVYATVLNEHFMYLQEEHNDIKNCDWPY